MMHPVDRTRIEEEIRRLEIRRAQIEQELLTQKSMISIRFLSEDLLKTNRTLEALRQHHTRFN